MREMLKKTIEKEMLYYSATTDIWTSCATESYISFTLHYVTESFEMQNWTIEIKGFSGKHTGEAIKESLLAIMCDWSLAAENLVMFMRDNASNGVSAMDNMGINHMGCVAHSMNLVISPLFFDKLKKKNDDNIDQAITPIEAEEQRDFVLSLCSNDNTMINSIRGQIKKMREISKYFFQQPQRC